MGKVYCSSDWHGCWDPAYRVIEYLKPNDKLYFLGDAIDRGKDGIKLMNKLLTDDRVIYLKGNHEEFMEKSLPLLIEGRSDSVSDNWLYQNGGYHTYNAIEYCSDESKMWYVNKIRHMPLEVKYTSPKGHTVIMEHAGYTPFGIPHRTHDPLWDREHFYDKWSDNEEEQSNPEINKTYLIHGHTPTVYLKYHYGYKDMPKITKRDNIEKRQFFKNIVLDGEEIIKPEVIRYCDGHKFDIDLCTVASGRIALIDLDTFEIIYFDKE